MMPLVALGTTLVVGGLVLANLIAGNRVPSEKRLQAELAKLKADLLTWATDLVPLNTEELELFSLGQDKQVLKKGVSATAKGIFTTIYHEPALAYTYRGYLGKPEAPNAILYAKTAEHEFHYWIRKGIATLFIDEQEVGTITPERELKGKRTGKTIARLQLGGKEMLPVLVGSREVGNLTTVKASGEKGLHERAFSFLKNDLTNKEEQLFLALVTLELVRRTIEA